MWLLYALLACARAVPTSVCPLSQPDSFTIRGSDTSHGVLILHNLTSVANVVLAIVTQISPDGNRTTVDRFPVVISGDTEIDLSHYDPDCTITVDFRSTLHSCAEVYWSGRRPYQTAYVSTPSGQSPRWRAWNASIWTALQEELDFDETNFMMVLRAQECCLERKHIWAKYLLRGLGRIDEDMFEHSSFEIQSNEARFAHLIECFQLLVEWERIGDPLIHPTENLTTHVSPTRTTSKCPPAPEYRTLNVSHDLLVIHNPTQADNVVMVTTTWGGRLEKFPLVIPARGSTGIEVVVSEHDETDLVSFHLMTHRICGTAYRTTDRMVTPVRENAAELNKFLPLPLTTFDDTELQVDNMVRMATYVATLSPHQVDLLEARIRLMILDRRQMT